MDKRKFFKKLDKNLGMTKIRKQIRAISSLFVFLVIGAAFAIYMNHNGIWHSYRIHVLQDQAQGSSWQHEAGL